MGIHSIESANSMLPLLKSITKDVIRIWDKITEQRKIMEEQEAKGIDTQDSKTILNEHIDNINGYIKEIEALGCFIEEFKSGIINIPSLLSGRKIFFTVMPLEEDVITYWHEIDEINSDKKLIGNLKVLKEK